MAHEAGKGDTQRPTNHKAYSEHFDNIFRNNRDRVVCPRCNKEFWVRPDEPHVHTCTPSNVRTD